LRYRMLFEDSFISSISYLELIIVGDLDRRLPQFRVLALNCLNSPYTLTNHIVAAAMVYVTTEST
jgi:hypothetical protein